MIGYQNDKQLCYLWPFMHRAKRSDMTTAAKFQCVYPAWTASKSVRETSMRMRLPLIAVTKPESAAGAHIGSICILEIHQWR